MFHLQASFKVPVIIIRLRWTLIITCPTDLQTFEFSFCQYSINLDHNTLKYHFLSIRASFGFDRFVT